MAYIYEISHIWQKSSKRLINEKFNWKCGGNIYFRENVNSKVFAVYMALVQKIYWEN